MREFRHLVIGLQESGKTTFAAALWYILDSEEVATKLKKGKHSGDFHYLEEIAKLWGDGWRAKRTGSTVREDVQINLTDSQAGREARLEFTDLSGESFEKIFATRRCDLSFVDLVNGAEGIILFVSARRKVDDHTLLDFAQSALLAKASEQPASKAPTVDPEYDPSKVPHQTQLVDLLDALSSKPFERKMPPLALIISAWDLSRKDTPEEWLQDTMPLLDQYLRTNETIKFRVYGVSAQGAELPKKEDGPEAMKTERLAILSLPKASDRINVVGIVDSKHDLTEPMHWLNSLSEEENGG